MKSSNNEIRIDQQSDGITISINFKKSIYSSTIRMYFVLTLIFLTVGLSALMTSFLDHAFDDVLFSFFWLFLVFLFGYLHYETILWLQKGKEVMTLKHDHVILQKIYPQHRLYGSTAPQTTTIETKQLQRVYYSKYIPYRNSLPSKNKGNLHFQDHQQTYSFAINLTQQECTPLIRLIKQNIPNIEINV